MKMLENTDNLRYSNKFTKLTGLIRSINFFNSESNDDYLDCFFSAATTENKNKYNRGERYSIYSMTPLLNAIAVKHDIIKETLDSRLKDDLDSLYIAIVIRWELDMKRVALIEFDDIHILNNEELKYISSKEFKVDIHRMFQKQYRSRVSL